jgi:hypothetical protein
VLKGVIVLRRRDVADHAEPEWLPRCDFKAEISPPPGSDESVVREVHCAELLDACRMAERYEGSGYVTAIKVRSLPAL